MQKLEGRSLWDCEGFVLITIPQKLLLFIFSSQVPCPTVTIQILHISCMAFSRVVLGNVQSSQPRMAEPAVVP